MRPSQSAFSRFGTIQTWRPAYFNKFLDPFRFVLIAVAGWMNQWEYQIIDYLREENRVLREQLGQRRLRFNDDQRRRLAVKAGDCHGGFWTK